MITLAMFTAVPAAQLGLSAAAEADRGIASALYFTAYYVAGGLASFFPGLAWEAGGWGPLAATVAAPVGAALLAATLPERRRAPSG